MSKPIRLVPWSEVLEDWSKNPYSTEEEEAIGRNLLNCMEYHPDEEGNVTKDSIESVVLVKDESPRQGWDDMDFIWVVRLKDGRNFLIDAWHDSTGWDCRSGATYTEMTTNE